MSESSETNGRVSDAVREHWADRVLPEIWRPFARLARLERPIGWWLLVRVALKQAVPDYDLADSPDAVAYSPSAYAALSLSTPPFAAK